MTDELLNAAILLRRGSWVDPELFERAAKRMAELEAALRSLVGESMPTADDFNAARAAIAESAK
jgi:hypothetical protein